MWLALGAARPSGGAPTPTISGVPLPVRSRSQEHPGHALSSRGFPDTVNFYRRWLKRRGFPYREVPPYQYRGVTVARFLPGTKGGDWAAIHVFLLDGRTHISIIAR